MLQADERERQEKAVQRSVGIATLRRLHNMIDSEPSQTAAQHKLGFRLLILAAALSYFLL